MACPMAAYMAFIWLIYESILRRVGQGGWRVGVHGGRGGDEELLGYPTRLALGTKLAVLVPRMPVPLQLRYFDVSSCISGHDFHLKI